MRVLTFTLADLATGRGLGHALICPDARYASIAWLGADRLDRRFVAPADWRTFLARLADHFPPTPFESTDIVPILLPAERRAAVTVQYVADMPLDAAPERVAERLDTWLRDLAGGTAATP
jgi:hypothetical protein